MRKIFSRIKALFRMNGENKEMYLERAEIKDGIVFLHSTEDPHHTFCVKTKDIDIHINPFGELRESDIWTVDNEELAGDNSIKQKSQETEKNTKPYDNLKERVSPKADKNLESSKEKNSQDKSKRGAKNKETEYELHPNGVADWPGYNKKIISFSIYDDEYEILMDYLHTNGYKRAEFFYSCIHAAKKKSMDATYQSVLEEHKRRRAETKARASAN